MFRRTFIQGLSTLFVPTAFAQTPLPPADLSVEGGISLPPPSPPGNSVLAQLAAAMAPGTWAPVNSPAPANLASSLRSGGAHMLVYTNNGAWNPVTKKMELLGQYHGAGNIQHVQYDEARHEFTFVGNIGTPAGHGYNHTTVNPQAGEVFFKHYHVGPGCPIWRRTPAGTWQSSYAVCPHYATDAGSACWWSGPLSGVGTQGALLMCDTQFGSVSGWDPLARRSNPNDDWFNVPLPSFNVPGGTYHGLAAYSRVKNVAVFAGGNSLPKQIWKMTSNRTITRLSDAPASCNIGIYKGALTADPVSGDFLVLSGRNLFAFNPDGNGTWTQLTGSRVPPAAVNDPDSQEMIWVELWEHGVNAAISVDAAGTQANMYLYKHA